MSEKTNAVSLLLNNIFLELFNKDFSIHLCDKKDELLLGNSLNLSARNLVYLLLKIEDTFDISFTETDILDGALSSYNSIFSCILKHKSA